MEKYNPNKLFTQKKNISVHLLWVHITCKNLASQMFLDRVAVIIYEVSQLHFHHEHLQKIAGEDPIFSPEMQNSPLLVQILIQFKIFEPKF